MPSSAAVKIGHRQQGHQGEDGNDRDILHQQDRKAGLPALAFHEVLFGKRLDDDGGRGERQHHADGERRLPRIAVEQGNARDGQRGEEDLPSSQAQQLAAHGPEPLGLHLQPDDEEHHHHAELGEDLKRVDIDIESGEYRADRHAGKEVTEHRTEPEPARQRYGNNPRNEDQEGEDQETGYLAFPLIAARVRYAAPCRS